MPLADKDRFQISLATKGDGNAFVDLFNSIYSRKINIEYFNWQYFNQENPSFMIKVTANNEIAGTLGGRYCEGHTITQDMPLLYVLDAMIKKEYRGKGFFQAMVEYCIKLAEKAEIPFAYGMANKSAYLPAIEMLESKLVAEIDDMVCETSNQAYPSGKFQIEKKSIFNDEDEAIKNEFLANHPEKMLIRRDPAYLNWRFNQNPKYTYDVFRINSDSHVFGYLVLKIFTNPLSGEKFGDIVDLLWGEDNLDMLRESLRFAFKYFSERGIPKSIMWLQTGTILDEIGRELGYKTTGQKRYFICKVLDPAFQWLENPKHWYISMADAEMY